MTPAKMLETFGDNTKYNFRIGQTVRFGDKAITIKALSVMGLRPVALAEEGGWFYLSSLSS